MTSVSDYVRTQQLSLPEELLLMLLNDKSGYFHQVPGWDLNCAIIGAVLAELSLKSRIDTDMESLFLLDPAKTGDPALDSILKEIADESVQRNAQYWIERLAPHAEAIVDSALERLVNLKVLQYHDGGFWTLDHSVWTRELYSNSQDGTSAEFVKIRIEKVIFANEIPAPRDVIIICLVNTCDVFRFMFELDEEAEERVEFICRMDLIGRSIAAAVSENLAGPLLRRSALTKKIPTVKLGRFLRNPHLRAGNLPALFADLADEYGPVFELKTPFAEPKLFIAGPEANRWVHRNGRMHLRSKDYFADLEKVYGAQGVLPALDGADHFRLRKAMSAPYSRARLLEQLDELFACARGEMANWTVGETYPAKPLSRRMINAQISPMHLGIDSMDILDDLIAYKERALTTHIIGLLPKFMLNTRGMKRKGNAIAAVVERVQSGHTTAQRVGNERDYADDILSLHASDPQFVPESNLKFILSAALLASMYLGDAFNFTLYALASQPALYLKIRAEADALFDGGDPDADDLTPAAIDVTKRFVTEVLRMYPIVPMSLRDVMNSCVIEGYQLPVGSRIHIAQTAAHYMEDVFPNPFTFDIDRYLPPRNEHHGPGYAPYGLGTHTCLGLRLVGLQLILNMLLVAHHFTVEVAPEGYQLGYSPLPSNKPDKKLKYFIADQRREFPA